MDAQGRITFVNPPATEMLGWKPEELLGREQHALIHHSRIDGSKYEAAECPILAAIGDGRIHRQSDEVFWRKDGSIFPVDCITTPIRKHGAIVGAVVAGRVVTERRQAAVRLTAEQAARREGDRLARQLQRVFMQVPAAVCTTRGPEHVIESANLRFQQLGGHSDLIGQSARDAFPKLSSQSFLELLDRVYTTREAYVGPQVAAVWDRLGDRTMEEGFLNLVCQPLRDSNDVMYGIMVHAVDVTELVRSRRLVERHAAELTRMTHSMARVNSELDQFAYVASHDLRAPLRGIASLAAWIEDDLSPQLSEQTRQHLALLRSRVQRMDALIEGVLQYSRAGRVRNRVEDVRVAELLRDVVEMLGPPAEASIDIGTGMPALRAERVPLQQVFLNLMGNAIKHSGRPDPVVSVRAREAGEFYEFTVQDNGPGIPARFHAKIWEIFQTLQPRDKVEGAGIGLALVKKNVEARDGKAWLESEEGRGTTFHFLWPKHTAQDGPNG